MVQYYFIMEDLYFLQHIINHVLIVTINIIIVLKPLKQNYNSEYFPYSPEYYQHIKGLGKRLDKKQIFRGENKNNISFCKIYLYDIVPDLL